MTDFTMIERQALRELRAASQHVNFLSNQESHRTDDILAQVAEKLMINEPVQVSAQKDDHHLLKYTCNTPIGKIIVALAANNDSSASTVQKQIVEDQCKVLVSFPERLANAVSETGNATFIFDARLYWERLCDTVLFFYFTKAQHSGNSEGVQMNSKHLLGVLKELTISLVRRGKSEIIMTRLGRLPRDLFDGELFCDRFAYLMEAVFTATKQSRFCLQARRPTEVSDQWHRWNSLLFQVTDKRSDIRPAILSALRVLINAPRDDNSTQLANNIFYTVCVNQLSVAGTTRSIARIILMDLLPTVAAGAAVSNNALSPREKECFTALFRKWENKEFVTSADLTLNMRLLHPVMYTLLYLHKEKPAEGGFPNAFLGALLTGVTIRLDSTRGPELQKCAMIVAAAYTTLFVSSADGVSPLLQDANFFSALQEWMKEEPGTSEYAPTLSTATQMKNTPSAAADVEMRVSSLVEVFPLDPDEEFHFFAKPNQGREEKSMVMKNIDADVPTKLLDSTEVPLPSFGQQKYTKDELDEHVSILGSIRECYNALVGVGRSPNAQLHEVQEATESGLRGLSDAFSKLRQQVSSDLFNVVSKETGPLVSVLLPTLISLSIHAPEEQKQHLLQLRYRILVDLIVLNPPLALNQLSEMVYCSIYGIYQRTELIKAIGEAASILSQVELMPARAAGMRAERIQVTTEKYKRIYPPIPTHELTSDRKSCIVVSEGTHTRRWGNAAVGRQNRVHLKHYSNLLGEVAAAFVAVFLHKLDADHFAFFQEGDPYTPCAILDSLTTVFQGITNVRHVAAELCEKSFDFFFAVCTRHPNLSVRKAAWTSMVEVMRTWCGVGPLWIRRKDGERILNRDAAAYGSLVFTTTWLSALGVLQQSCAELVQKDDPCGRTALIAVSTLRDLVCDRDDFHSMLARVENHALGE